MTSNSRHKTGLLHAIEREWTTLLGVIDRLTPEQMTTPDAGGWSPKDNLAHLSEWMKALMGYHMDRRPSHEVVKLPPEVTKDWDPLVINEHLFARNKYRPAEEILAELKQVYAELFARLEAMPFDDLMKPRYDDDPEKTPLLVWVLGDTTGHFAEHRATIEKALKKV
jgi:hypothetical protein